MIFNRSVICQNCGEKILTVGKTAYLAIPSINYECTCGSRGVLEMITATPLLKTMKPDEFVNNPQWAIVVFPKSRHQIQHISLRTNLRTLCGRPCARAVIHDLYSDIHLCQRCSIIYKEAVLNP